MSQPPADPDAFKRALTITTRAVAGEKDLDIRFGGEIAGIASNDADIASLVQVIGGREPFAEVNLDYSRSRTVRARPARDFRLSFIVDMDHAFEVEPAVTVDATAAGGTTP